VTYLNPSVSKFAHLYLGNPETDPTPVFRDLNPNALLNRMPWPEGSVFAVLFPEGKTVFYGSEGWPLGWPEGQKLLGTELKLELQLSPISWPSWGAGEWQAAKKTPHLLRRNRQFRGLLRPLAAAVLAPSID